MAVVKTRLLKGHTLQRLVVLFLLSLAGLGHPPDFCEAIKCYCTPGPGCPQGADQVDCKPEVNSCQVISGDGKTHKNCDPYPGYLGFGEQVFKCVQNKAGGSGNCVSGSESQLQKALCGCLSGGGAGHCGGPGPGPGGHHRRRRAVEGSNGPFTWNDTLNGRTPGGETVTVFCSCRSDLCNSDTSALGGSGRLVTTGSKVVQGGIAGLIIIPLATNGLFF